MDEDEVTLNLVSSLVFGRTPSLDKIESELNAHWDLVKRVMGEVEETLLADKENELVNRRVLIEGKIFIEELHLKKMVDLSLSGTDPEAWENPWKILFAMSVLPNYSRPDEIENAKGMRLLSTFYNDKNTLEQIPDWILVLSKQGEKELVRSAERVRADLPKILWIKKNKTPYQY